MLRPAAIAIAGLLSACVTIPPAQEQDAAPDGACLDEDGDGWLAGEDGACATAAYLDCDDGDDAVHPGAREAAGGVPDRDCDGVPWDGVVSVPPVEVGEILPDDLQIVTGGLRLRVDAERGHSIEDLEIGGSGDLLYDGPVHENLIGIEAWDSFFSVEPGGDGREILAQNPAVLRFQVTWSDGADLTGTTTWTVHAGGRMYRRDDFDLATAPSFNNVTAYVQLDGPAIDAIDWESNGAPIPIAFAPGVFDTWANSVPSTDWLCGIDSAGHEIGLLSMPTTSIATDGVRITRAQGCCDDTRHVALQYDWTIGGPVPLGDYSGSFQIVAAPTPGSPCATVAQADLAWRNPPAIAPEAIEPVVIPGGEDLDGDAFAEGGGYWAIAAGPSPFEMTLGPAGAVGETTTFRIDDLPAGDPVVLLDHGDGLVRLSSGLDYQIGREDDQTWLVLRAQPGDVIRLVSPPS